MRHQLLELMDRANYSLYKESILVENDLKTMSILNCKILLSLLFIQYWHHNSKDSFNHADKLSLVFISNIDLVFSSLHLSCLFQSYHILIIFQ